MSPRAYTAATAALAVASAAWLRLRVPTDVPLGPDAPLWGLAALGLADGRGPAVPPGYPAVVAVTAALTGLPAWAAGGVVSTLATAALAAAVAFVARALDAPPAVALAAGAAVVLTPDLAAFAVQLQPDALTALLFVAWLAAALRFGPVGAVAAALPVVAVREHGAPLVAISAAVAVLAATPARLRAGALGAGALVAVVAVAFALTRPDLLPDRLTRPLTESALGAGGPLPHFAGELGGARAAAFKAAWREGDRLAVWLATLAETGRRSGLTLGALAVGAAAATAALRRRAWPWAAALGTLTPFVLVWSQRRHFAVLLPIAWIGVAAGLGALGRRRPGLARALGPFALALAAAAALVGLRPGRGKPPAERPAVERQALAARLAALPGSWALGGHDHDVNLYLGWTRNTVPADVSSGEVDGAAWRTVWIDAPGAMTSPWVEIAHEGRFAAFTLAPPPGDAGRPCADARIVPGPMYAEGAWAAHTEPPCRAALLPRRQRSGEASGL